MNDQAHNPYLKVVKPINFLFHRAEATLNDLVKHIAVAKELFQESVRLDLHPSGPIHWHYYGFTGDPTKSFTLEICLPVTSVPNDYDGMFHFKRTESFKCISVLHEGSWQAIPRSYDTIMKFIQQQNLQMGGVTRELYINSDFNDPEANVTEIQMSIA